VLAGEENAVYKWQNCGDDAQDEGEGDNFTYSGALLSWQNKREYQGGQARSEKKGQLGADHCGDIRHCFTNECFFRRGGRVGPLQQAKLCFIDS